MIVSVSLLADALIARLNPQLPYGCYLERGSAPDMGGVVIDVYTDEGCWGGDGIASLRETITEPFVPGVVEMALDGLQDSVAHATHGIAWPSDPNTGKQQPRRWARVEDRVLSFGYGSLTFANDVRLSDLAVTGDEFIDAQRALAADWRFGCYEDALRSWIATVAIIEVGYVGEWEEYVHELMARDYLDEVAHRAPSMREKIDQDLSLWDERFHAATVEEGASPAAQRGPHRVVAVPQPTEVAATRNRGTQTAEECRVGRLPTSPHPDLRSCCHRVAGAVTAATVAVAALALATGGATATVPPVKVVLGSQTSVEPHGSGWGTPHPAAVGNGGDPSGNAWGLRWTHWGSRTTTATGFTYLEPTLKQGWRKGRLQFRALRIGHCSANGPRAYTRLEVRVAELHGGSFSTWHLWNERTNLCHPSP